MATTELIKSKPKGYRSCQQETLTLTSMTEDQMNASIPAISVHCALPLCDVG